MQEILKVINLTKNYLKNDHDFKALDDINFTLKKGDSLAIVGESGCGKSTLANILIRLETPTTGEVLFKDKNIHIVVDTCRNIDFYEFLALLSPSTNGLSITSRII